MGVTGLWKLIEASGKPVPIETLENKVLAIDISIWLHQVIKGFQDNKGSQLANAHLLGLFHRLCKLLYYRIKPVFVFDGGVPQLKRETIAKRSQSRNKLLDEADRVQNLILQALAKEKVVQQALGPNATEILKSPVKPIKPNQKPDKDDIFKLPDLPNEQHDLKITETSSTDVTITSESDSSFDDNNLRHAYSHNIQSIDVSSAHFKSLPADIRHEILTDIKETRKQSSWGRLHELPVQGDDFSVFQMKRLLKRRQVQLSLEEAEQQMGGKSLTISELQMLLSEDGVISESTIGGTKRIASDENTRFLLVRDLKKTFEKAAKQEQEEDKPTASADIKEEKSEPLGKEYHYDLKKAIELSLETANTCNNEDYEDGEVKMTKAQREQLKSAVTSLARAYMIEYGGMNDDDVKNLLEQTQAGNNEEEELPSSFKYNDRFITKGEVFTPYKGMVQKFKDLQKKKLIENLADNTDSESVDELKITPTIPSKKEENDEIQLISDSDEDSDFLDVANDDNPIITIDEADDVENVIQNKNEKLEIVVDFTKEMNSNDDDIFADIFLGSTDETKLEQSNTSEILNEKNKKHELVHVDASLPLKKSALVVEEEILQAKSNLRVKDILSEESETSKDAEKNVHKEQGKIVTEELNCVPEPFAIKPDDKKEESIVAAEPEIFKPENILSKLKADLENVSKITLDEINVPNDIHMENTQTQKEHLSISNKIIETKNIESENDNQDELSIAEKFLKIKPIVDPKNILENLKQQVSEISKLNLDNIVTPAEEVPTNQPTTSSQFKDDDCKVIENCEIIEIPDNNGNEDNRTEQLKTPSKNKIENFFEAEYFIKRTPEKIKEDDDDVPKVQSPFFRNKSPKSTSSEKLRKRKALLDEDESSSPKKNIRISKSLFEKSLTGDDGNDIKPLEPEVIDPIELAAQTLRENKSREQLEDIASEIAKERQELEFERNRQGRMGTSITEKMSCDCMYLLRLFGVPYIVAPMEAEAQCAFLDAIELTDGTITDDSDIWLFGGRTVYKNFFNERKHVMEFKVGNIEKLYNMDRSKLIQLAILVGSDYTTGISGIGAVTALEILSTFSRTPIKEGETNELMSVLSSLRKFREWWKAGRNIGPMGRTALRSKLKNIELIDGFPNSNIVEAYLNPKVDNNRDKFRWGTPDIETIREFAKKTFGWTKTRTDELLNPVLKKMNEKKSQTSIKNYFTIKSALSIKELKVSKRVQKAINKMSVDYKSDEEEPKVKKPRKRTNKTRKKNAAEPVEILAITNEQNNGNPTEDKTVKPKKTRGKRAAKTETSEGNDNEKSSGSEIAAKIAKNSKNMQKSAVPVNTKEKDMLEMEKRKQIAAELFKRSRESQKPMKTS